MDINQFCKLTAGTSITLTKLANADYTASKLILKRVGVAPIVIAGVKNGSNWIYSLTAIATAEYPAGKYSYQVTESAEEDKIISASGIVQILPDLETADTAYDPRSADEIILDAVIAVMTGTASQKQRSVKVGDQEISFMSFAELAEKREYFEALVASQQSNANSGSIRATFIRR